MEFFLNRYRNLSVLLVAILAQLILLAYQVKSNQDVRLIRVWAMAAVTPLARLIETARSGTSGFLHDYFVLLDVREQNKHLKEELDRSEIENQYLHAQLSIADTAKSLAIFQATSQSNTVAARIIMNTTDTGGKTVVVDRGASSGIQKNMAVITREGIVGKVIDVYPWSSNVLLITDAAFGAGVVSRKHQVLGELKGQGKSTVMIDNVQNEEKVEEGDWFETSGQDLIFPRGLTVGQVTLVRAGKSKKEIFLAPSGIQNLTAVLIVTDAVQHGTIPEGPAASQSVHLLKPPPGEDNAPAPDANAPATATGAAAPSMQTDADRVTQSLKSLGPLGLANRPAPNFNAPRPSNPPTGAKPPPASPPNP